MATSKLQNNLHFLRDKVKTNGFVLYFEIKHLKALLIDQADQLKEFKKSLQNKRKNHQLEKKNGEDIFSYVNFFDHHFHEIFLSFVEEILGLKKTSFKLSWKDIYFQSTLVFEYKYYISPEEEECLEKFFSRVGNQKHITDYFVGFFFSVFGLLGLLIRSILSERFYAFLDHSVLKYDEYGKYWHFSIIVKDTKNELRQKYLKTGLINFLRQFKDIPADYFGPLFEERSVLYNRVLKDYSTNIKENLNDLMRFFSKKTINNQNLSPLLDILNFVCSRVEDTHFDKIDVIKRVYLTRLNYSLEKKRSLVELFRFIDFNSTLYTTFSSNNLPSPKAQFDLFLLYAKYYFSSGLEVLEQGDLLFLPDIFVKRVKMHNETKISEINSKTIENIDLFLDYFSFLNNFDENQVFFEEIFGCDISSLNFWFFNGFLNSFNQKFLDYIEAENQRLLKYEETKPFTFEVVVDHLCQILLVLIETIFLGPSLEEVSKNFVDPRGRYIPPNIAMRVKELFFFQEMNFSDDLWPYFMVSLQKENLKKDLSNHIVIPDNYFYTSVDLAKLLIHNNFKSYSNPQVLEEWLFNDIIVPLNEFVLKFQDHPKDIALHESLSKIFLDEEMENDISTQIRLVCKKIAPYWKTLENS